MVPTEKRGPVYEPSPNFRGLLREPAAAADDRVPHHVATGAARDRTGDRRHAFTDICVGASVLYLAKVAPNPGRARQVAEALCLPENHLSTTLRQLTQAGVLTSDREPAGGFRLAVPPEELTLGVVIGRFDPQVNEDCCIFACKNCPGAHACQVYTRGVAISGRLRSIYREPTVADLRAARTPR
jgi:Rrf2 family protein